MMLIRTTHLFALVSICVCVSSVVAQEEVSKRYVLDASSASYGSQDQDEVDEVQGDDKQSDAQTSLEVLLKINMLRRRSMAQISVDVREFSKEAPKDVSLALTSMKPETWTTFEPSPVGVAWAAPNIRYQPLFFENVPLERYGQTRGPWREVAASSIHFYSSLALWPYHARFDHIKECDYPLGFCRPGNQVPGKRQLQFWGW